MSTNVCKPPPCLAYYMLLGGDVGGLLVYMPMDSMAGTSLQLWMQVSYNSLTIYQFKRTCVHMLISTRHAYQVVCNVVGKEVTVKPKPA